MGLGFRQSGKNNAWEDRDKECIQKQCIIIKKKIEQNAQTSRGRKGAKRRRDGKNANKLQAGKDTEDKGNARDAQDGRGERVKNKSEARKKMRKM